MMCRKSTDFCAFITKFLITWKVSSIIPDSFVYGRNFIMRVDGRRARGLSAIEMAIPHVMRKRVDAQNYVTEYADEEIIRNFLRAVRQEKGIRMSRMAVIIAAYYAAARKHPYVNRFIMNSRVYERNHFCVSFVMLKVRADGTPDETTVKIFLDETDDVFSINDKIHAVIEKNSVPTHNNNTDKFARMMFSLPLLPDLVMGLARILDRCGLLPRFIIDLSPFHTSLFVTNLASINAPSIYHHVYEFGTTSVFVSVGKNVPNYLSGELKKKLIPLKVVMDERICTGHDYTMFNKTFQHFMSHPELLDKTYSKIGTKEMVAEA